ncbi:MAG TPA: SUMF1/EgtB/PvdO family nonheme iron enzyme [Thermoanaerobaculia bacterium]
MLGDPGAGKTTLLRHFTASLAMERTRSWVPLFHSLPQLLRTQDFILDPVGIRMERLGYSGERLKALLDRCGREGRLVLLLDGLDEVPRERCEEAEQILRGLADRWPKIPLVVTSRPIGYRRPGPDFRELVLLPLDRARQRDFLARWLGRATGEPDAVKAAQALTSLDSPHLRELAGNPLYLTLMALLWESGIEPDRNRTRLYDQVFALLFEGRHHGSRREPLEAQETVRAVLRRLAYEMTVENLEAEPVTALEERLRSPKLDGLRITLERVAGWSRMRQFLDDIAQRTGILGPHDGPAADWRFWHRTFREALTAEQLAEDYREERAKHGILSRFRSIEATLAARAQCVKTEEDLSNWAEPFALLVGQVDNPDQLVRSLVRKNRLLGLRAMATAQNLSDDTLRQILALTDKWKQRCKVLRAIPELVAEPRRALALLDRLRRQTRNGNDLFFLDQAVQEVARCAPENAREASDIRAGFYAHIPPPPEDLFLWIDTPIDGRVPLWRELPAGRFRMGSPEGEGHSSEHPCHEVVIAQPFRLGAGPVTVAQYMAFDPKRRFHNWERVADEELPNSPAIGITWYEAVSFCRWLASAWTWARGARLPIEEEWEYACRADTESRYWSGEDEEDLERVGWYRNNSGRRKSWRDYTGNPALDFSEPTTDHRTHRVGEKPANPWGLYDLHGNVQEWTVSPWTESYEECKREKIVNPATIDFEEAIREVPSDGRRVMRGGSSWNAADLVRAAYRFQRDPGDESLAQGFRVVLPAK